LNIIDNKKKLIDGISIFINEKEYAIDSQNLKLNSQYIGKIKIDYYGEIYEKVIDKYVDSDIKITLIPHEFRNSIYDFVKTKWLIKSDRLVELNGNKKGSYFLLKSKS
jgi:hypothetical protein